MPAPRLRPGALALFALAQLFCVAQSRGSACMQTGFQRPEESEVELRDEQRHQILTLLYEGEFGIWDYEQAGTDFPIAEGEVKFQMATNGFLLSVAVDGKGTTATLRLTLGSTYKMRRRDSRLYGRLEPDLDIRTEANGSGGEIFRFRTSKFR